MSYTNEYRINVDIKKPTTNVLPTFVQYDSAALIFKIYDNGVEFDLRNFERAEVIHKKPNGSVSYGIGQLVTLENGKDAIKYKYLGGEMNQVGNVLTSLTIFSTDDTKLSVHPFNVKILEDIREDLGDQVREEISFLEQLVEGADGIVADAKIASRRIDEAMQDIYANVSSIEAIAQEESQRQANEITRTQDMSNRIHKGTYSNTVQYYKHNEVLHNGSTYRCLVNSIGIIPTNTSNWTMVSQRGNDGNAGVTSVAGKTGAIVLSASDVGLGNVTNQSKSSMLTSPTLTGTPTAPTAANTTNTTQIATTAFVKSLLAIIETTMGTLTSLTTTVKTSIVAAINSLKSETDTHISNTNVHTTSTEKTTWNAKYTKPTNGIPSSDLTTSIQTSLGKADSALQSVADASTSAKGIVQLNNSLTSTSTTQAVTAAQAKLLNDNLTSHISDTTKKHIEIVDEIPANLQGKGIFFEKQGGVSNAPNKPVLQEIPSYWENHIESKINRIRQLQDEDGLNRCSIGFITDMHLAGNNEKHSGMLMNKIDEEILLSFVINGGDCVSHYQGSVSKENAIGQIREMFRMFSPRVVDKMLYTVANHDDNSHSNQNWSNTLKEGELYSQYFRHLDNKVVRGETPRYYYIDNDFHKTRFIVLDCNDVPYIEENNRAKYPISNFHAFRQTQLEWFANVALTIPDDTWSVIVVSHAPPYQAGVSGFDRPVRNAEMALGILGAFRNKTTYTGISLSAVISDFQATVSADFTRKGGEVICWLAGDTHQDNVVTMTPYADIKLITTINDHKNRLSGAPQGRAGTISEQAFDILTIDKANKKVYLTRIGAGSDREFLYLRSTENGGGDVEGTLIFEDNFNRADSTTLGGNWTLERGQVGINNNAAKPSSAGATTSIALYNANVTQNNIRIESTFAHNGGINGIGLAFRYQDDLNYVRLSIEYGNIVLVNVENDVKTTLATVSFPYTNTQPYTIRVDLIGEEIKIYVDNTLQMTGISNKYLTTVKCGIRAWAGGDNIGTYYNFKVKEI